jgi:hypothetical protein
MFTITTSGLGLIFHWRKLLFPRCSRGLRAMAPWISLSDMRTCLSFALPVAVLVMHNKNVLMGMMRRGLFTLARFYVALHKRKMSVDV